MNILKFIESFKNEKFNQTHGSRRDSFGQFKKMGSDLAMASVPFGIASLALGSQKTSAATFSTVADTPISALQLALTLEYLEDEFYELALSSGVIPLSENGGRDRKVFEQISQHENSHVAFLIAGLGGPSGANFVPKPTFDFTVNGAFNPFGDYPTFLALAQAFEDTGVRAYKGQATNLISTPDLLTAALQIHSVEARHASEVRRLRGLKGWITGNVRGAGMPVQSQAVYDGEQNTNQAGYNTSALFGADAGTESYDEPLTGAQATAIASLFIVA